MIRKLIAALLALVFICTLCAGVCAESAIDLTDLTLHTSSASYSMPASLEEARAAGINIQDFDPPAENEYYFAIPADDGRSAFKLRVDYCAASPDLQYITGWTVSQKKAPGASIGGLVLGETTAKEVVAALGADNSGYEKGETLHYSAMHGNVQWQLKFDGKGKKAKLEEIYVYTYIPARYGLEFSPAAPDANLPAPEAMGFDQFILGGKLYQKGDNLQKLIDNGWVVDARFAGGTVEAREEYLLHSQEVVLYNGTGTIRVSVYNPTDADAPLAECLVHEVETKLNDKSGLVLANNLTPGVSTIKDVQAVLGEPVDKRKDDNEVIYKFKVLNGVTYTIVEEDKQIISIEVSDLV